MKYLNGQLRNEHDATLCTSAYSRKRNMTVEEYVPIVALIALMASFLVEGLLG
jgi:hypothetical protein